MDAKHALKRQRQQIQSLPSIIKEIDKEEAEKAVYRQRKRVGDLVFLFFSLIFFDQFYLFLFFLVYICIYRWFAYICVRVVREEHVTDDSSRTACFLADDGFVFNNYVLVRAFL